MTRPLEQDMQTYKNALTLKMIRELTGLPIRTIRGAVQRGDLKAIRPAGSRIWRVPPEEVGRWLKAAAHIDETDRLD